MNEVLKVITERYTCRDYDIDKMPSDEILQLITDAGCKAPSGRNRQAWQMVVIKNKELIKALEEEATQNLAKLEDSAFYDRIMSYNGKVFYNSPCMIMIAIDSNQLKPALMDCGILCQNIVLAATSLGVDSTYCGLAGMAFNGDKAQEFSEQLGFYTDYVFGCAILLGYSNNVKHPHKPDSSKVSVIE